jgi:hypothetical protein
LNLQIWGRNLLSFNDVEIKSVIVLYCGNYYDGRIFGLAVLNWILGDCRILNIGGFFGKLP